MCLSLKEIYTVFHTRFSVTNLEAEYTDQSQVRTDPKPVGMRTSYRIASAFLKKAKH